MHDNLVGMPIRLTYEDYCELPDDGMRYEILDGDLYMSPSPIRIHQRIVANLLLILDPHVRRNLLGEIYIAPFDVLLSDHNIVEPDLIFVSNARSAILTDKNIKGAPDLLVEVLSPSSERRDQHDKRNIYARWGVDWYWIVDPDGGTLMELQRVDTAYAEISKPSRGMQFTPKLFPGLSINVNSLWDSFSHMQCMNRMRPEFTSPAAG